MPITCAFAFQNEIAISFEMMKSRYVCLAHSLLKSQEFRRRSLRYIRQATPYPKTGRILFPRACYVYITRRAQRGRKRIGLPSIERDGNTKTDPQCQPAIPGNRTVQARDLVALEHAFIGAMSIAPSRYSLKAVEKLRNCDEGILPNLQRGQSRTKSRIEIDVSDTLFSVLRQAHSFPPRFT